MKTWISLTLMIFSLVTFANPYPYENEVALDQFQTLIPESAPVIVKDKGSEVIRIDVNWRSDETYQIVGMSKEYSGTPGLIRHTRKLDPHGSYRAKVLDPINGTAKYFQTIGTGSEFRKLSGTLSFRFPKIDGKFRFVVEVEHPKTGDLEVVIDETLDSKDVTEVTPIKTTQRILKAAKTSPKVVMAIYSEGYSAASEDRFFRDAQKIITTIERYNFPLNEHFEYRAVFSSSNQKLGRAQDLGTKKERDSFLGLYFPYWNKFGRWYHVLYPTNVKKYRDALAQSPYDHPITLVDDSGYWGVGNFQELTAIPARNSRFEYLLMHEFGHYFGLNEEYEGGGPTELQFAPETEEPWSQNITFLKDPKKLKWQHLLSAKTPVPTPRSYWSRTRATGAYRGGYADSHSVTPSHKPGYACIMSSGRTFCPVCNEALKNRIERRLE